jgi:hypothetical protein
VERTAQTTWYPHASHATPNVATGCRKPEDAGVRGTQHGDTERGPRTPTPPPMCKFVQVLEIRSRFTTDCGFFLVQPVHPTFPHEHIFLRFVKVAVGCSGRVVGAIGGGDVVGQMGAI